MSNPWPMKIFLLFQRNREKVFYGYIIITSKLLCLWKYFWVDFHLEWGKIPPNMKRKCFHVWWNHRNQIMCSKFFQQFQIKRKPKKILLKEFSQKNLFSLLILFFERVTDMKLLKTLLLCPQKSEHKKHFYSLFCFEKSK